uniref:Uncharacterized protein n=1 Tax=Avena sativa TaxID=4498 RepID=A0ACD5TZJ5_AVESA
MVSPKLGAGSIASRWRELQGSGSWAGLLDPLDDDLRASIIAYGEHAQAAYDGLNSEKRSPNAGCCLYSQATLLAATGVSHPEHYTVTKFLYATEDLGHVPIFAKSVAKAFFVHPVLVVPAEARLQGRRRNPDPKPSSGRAVNWIGYVAVATDKGAAALGRRDIVVAWRGTVEGLEMVKDVVFMGVPAAKVLQGTSPGNKFPCAGVHGGFLSVYTAPEDKKHNNPETCMASARNQALEEVRRLMEAHKDEVTSITVTGHSLGAALATLNAVDMVASGVNVPPVPSKQPPCPVTPILFACPKVGNRRFKAAFASFPALRALHVKNYWDMVPKMPPLYTDAATATLLIDTARSPYLRRCNFKLLNPFGDMITFHNLECYLHGVAGDHGARRDFELVVDRDVALVNKSADALTDIHAVPASWWVLNNKCMVKQADGHWKLEDGEAYKTRV